MSAILIFVYVFCWGQGETWSSCIGLDTVADLRVMTKQLNFSI